MNIWNMASESVKTESEIELVIYAKISNPSGLELAVDKIHQREIIGELLVSRDEKPQRWRIRETQDSSYIFTTKKRVAGQEGLNSFIETNCPVDKNLWEALKPMAQKAHDKHRYVFIAKDVSLAYTNSDFKDKREVKIPSLKYEVDVYIPPSGEEPVWCKIDIELQDALEYLKNNYPEIEKANVNIGISHLPFKPTDAILANDPDPTKQKFLGVIWDTQFNLKPTELK